MRLVEQFYKFIAPSDCLSCSSEGSLICKWCVDDVIMPHDSRCYKCNKLTSNFAVCSACRRKTPLKNVFIRTEYTGVPKELVQKMKFSYSVEAADIIADELMNTLPVLPPETIIINVPTITSHQRMRGFDHSQKIAKKLSMLSGLEYCPVLTRLNQASQVGSGRKQRMSQQQGAFRVRDNQIMKDQPILLVDDVITTGATLESAAETLKRSGARNILAAVFARSTL